MCTYEKCLSWEMLNFYAYNKHSGTKHTTISNLNFILLNFLFSIFRREIGAHWKVKFNLLLSCFPKYKININYKYLENTENIDKNKNNA